MFPVQTRAWNLKFSTTRYVRTREVIIPNILLLKHFNTALLYSYTYQVHNTHTIYIRVFGFECDSKGVKCCRVLLLYAKKHYPVFTKQSAYVASWVRDVDAVVIRVASWPGSFCEFLRCFFFWQFFSVFSGSFSDSFSGSFFLAIFPPVFSVGFSVSFFVRFFSPLLTSSQSV